MEKEIKDVDEIIDVKNEVPEEEVKEEMVTISKKELENAIQTIQNSTASIKDLNDKYLRALADYQNLQRISSIRISNSKIDERVSLFKEFLPILDNFERALENENIDEGVNLIYKQFKDILSKYNIEEINPAIGDIFDDSIQEAVAAIPCTEEDKKNTIVYIQSKGYKLNDTILRYCKVGVYV